MNSRMCFALLVGFGFACASVASAQSAVLPDAPLVPATGPAVGKPAEVARLLRQLAQARTLVDNALDLSQSMQVENQRLRGEATKLRKALADQRDLTSRLQRVEDQLRIEISRLQIQIASLRGGRPFPPVIPVPPATTRPAPVPAPATQPAPPAVAAVFEGRVESIGHTSALISFPIDRLVGNGEKFHIFRGTKLVATFIAQRVALGSAIGEVSDAKEAVKVGDRVVRTSKASAPAPAAAPIVPGGKGRVKGIHEDLAAITLGKDDGVTKGMQFYIRRGEKLVAVFTADHVTATESVGRLADVKTPVQIGDRVVPKTGPR